MINTIQIITCLIAQIDIVLEVNVITKDNLINVQYWQDDKVKIIYWTAKTKRQRPKEL